MKKLFLSAILFIASCEQTPAEIEAEQLNSSRTNNHISRELIKEAPEIIYFREKRADDLCFAYFYQRDMTFPGNARTGGPVLSTVDCGKVKHLLINDSTDSEKEKYLELKKKYEGTQ